MSEKREFEAVIKEAQRGVACIRIPFDVEEVFGKKRVPVKATLDGELYRGSLVRMKTSYHILGVRKDIRDKIGKSIGDSVKVVIEEDTEPRVVAVPNDLKRALQKEAKVKAFFDRLSYTHQKEYVNWINEAKKEETRRNRIERALAMMRAGKRGK